MKKDNTIRSNEELYGDFELIPLPLDAVQQRIDFFDWKIGELLTVHWMEQDSQAVNDCIKHRAFWQGIKEEHCVQPKRMALKDTRTR